MAEVVQPTSDADLADIADPWHGAR